jgi:hypothetical protein
MVRGTSKLGTVGSNSVTTSSRAVNAKSLTTYSPTKPKSAELMKSMTLPSLNIISLMWLSRLQHLSDIEHQKLRALRQKDPDSAATVEWLRRSQHLFKMEVLEPPCITLKLKDSRYADQIDACFSGIQMRTFVTQCVEDNKTFNRLVNDTPEALGKKARVATWYRPRRETAPPPMSPEEMQRLGFDTYAIDQVDYPEGLLWFLENSISLHRTAIALNPRGVDTNAAMHAVANPATGGNANFIVGRVYNQIQRSNYGQRLPTNTTRDVPPTRNFSGQTGQFCASCGDAWCSITPS